jgi:hypothetical protein
VNSPKRTCDRHQSRDMQPQDLPPTTSLGNFTFNQSQESGVAPPRFELARQHLKRSWSANNGDAWRIIKMPLTGSATKHYDRPTNAHLRPD